MKVRILHRKRAVFAVLLTLLLSVAGVTNAFAQTFTSGNLNYSLNDDGASVTVTGHVDGTDATGELVIPESVELYGTTYPVTVIGSSAFSGCSGLTGTLVIPNSVIYISNYAFYYCHNMQGSLVLGNGVKTIDNYAFYYCGFTGTLTIPENVTIIRERAFGACYNFTSLIYNAINCSIYDTWLASSNYLTTLTIGENVQVIPSYFLYNHSSFSGELVIPESVTSIGSYAFYNCTGFTGNLSIGEGVASIGGCAFYGCTGFTGSLTIGNSVRYINENAFRDCSGFTGSLTIPNSVSNIGTNAFSGCTSFSGTLTLGYSVTQIGNTAFFGACSGFTSFDVLTEVPPTLGNNVFISADYGIPVSVPCGSLNAYQNAEGWTVFTNLQESNPCQWIITAEVNLGSGGTINGIGVYEQGSTCTLVANPNENFSFVNWTEDGVEVSTDAAYAFTVIEDRHLVANFQINNAIGEGTATHQYLPSNNSSYYSLTQQIYTAEEIGQMGVIKSVAFFNAGGQTARKFDFYLMHTEKSSFSSSNDWVAVTQADKVFSGYVTMFSNDWTIITFDTPFTYDGTSNLVLVVDDNTGGYDYYSNMACRVFGTTDSQAIYISSSTNYDPTNPSQYNGTRPTVKNQIALGFSSLDAAVFATVSPEGTGLVSGEGIYPLGETCSLTATASSNDYVFVNWTENGEVISTNAQYSFTVTGNRHLVANFLQFRVDITAFADPDEGGTVTGAGNYLLGQTCTLTATANDGYSFVNWTENGQEVSTSNTYSFTVTGNRALVAHFVDPIGVVLADYYPDNTNPGSPYVMMTWNPDVIETMIGDETSTTFTTYMPFYTTYNYSISEALFTAAELDGAGMTTSPMISLSWEAVEVTTNQTQNNISIWMANVTDTELTTTSHLANYMTLVYTGNIGIPPLGWNEFVFNEGNFAWDGTSNVLILVQRNNGSWNGSVKWRSHNPGFNGMTYKYQDNTPYNVMNNTYEVTCSNNSRPNTLFKSSFDNSSYGISYKVYRKECNSNNYSLIANNMSEMMYVDSSWLQLPVGSYQYGISAVDRNGNEGEIVSSNCIDRNYYSYQITATPNMESRGTISGAGEYALGAICTLSAIPIGTNTFTRWTENGIEVSTEANYSFTVTGPRSLVAVFSVAPEDIIVFADNNVKTICVSNWDIDGDGELAYDEAAAVTDLGSVFRSHSEITSFNELQYFTGLTSIGYRAFYYCYNLSSVTLPSSVTSIDSYAFYNSGLSGTFVVPSTVTSIGSYAFAYCYNLMSVNISGGVTYLNDNVFYNCYNLSSITLPTSLTSIGSSAFQFCSSLSSITLPNTVTYIYSNAFNGCTGLTSVEFSSSLYSIGYRAFYGCSSLTGTLDLPNGVNSIWEEAFMDCTALSGLNLSQNLGSIGTGAFRNCSGIRGEITLPASLGSVGEYAFYGCDGISTVNYNATNCSSFGSASSPVFYDCAFPHLNIGANVQSIPDYAFKHCFMITDINVAAVNPPTVYSSTFGMVPRSIPVTVPVGSGDAYRSAQYWEEFFNIMEGSSDNTQISPLAEGWNWWSSYIELTDNDGLGQLENSIGSAGMIIKSRTNGYVEAYQYGGETYWYGTLGSINNEQMYKIRTNAACNAIIVGDLASPADHPITINSGWNWIGFPCNQNVGVDVALSGFTPANNDIIKGRNGYTTYYSDANYSMWYGTLNTLESGKGYMYRSNSSASKTLTFQTSRGESAAENITSENNHYRPNSDSYADNMTIAAVLELDGEELRSDEYELAAFVGDECRGSVRLMYVEPLGRYIAFLTVFGEQSETLSFRLTNGTQSSMSSDDMAYVADGVAGTMTEPVTLRFGTLSVDDNEPLNVVVYPNPSDGVFNIQGQGIRKIEVFNPYGQIVLSKEISDDFLQIDLGSCAKGIYMLRVITDKGMAQKQIIKH